MTRDGPSCGVGKSSTQPAQRRLCRLAVPDYSSREYKQTHETRQRVDIDCSNNEHLLSESKDDPQWHSSRIPLERRKVLRLPVFSWEHGDKNLEEDLYSEIETLLETEDHSRTLEGTTHPGSFTLLIPIERKKRKRIEMLPPSDYRSTGASTTRKGDSDRTQETGSASAPLSSAESPKSLPVVVAAQESSHETGKTSSLSASKDQSRRSESPPMRILCVRSLANNSSYLYDSLEERIPVDAPGKAGDDQPPLYIFNPVKRYSDTSRGRAQNDVHPVGNSETSIESPSDMPILIDASNDSEKGRNVSRPTTHASEGSNLNVTMDVIGTSLVREPSCDASRDRRGPQKVTREDKREIGSGTAVPILQDLLSPVGRDTPRTSAIPTLSTSSSRDGIGTFVDNWNRVQIHDSARPHEATERLLYTCTSNDMRFAIGFDPNSSPFEDSEDNEDEIASIRPTHDPIRPSFTSCVLKELDTNSSEAKENAPRFTDLDHPYSRPISELDPLTPNLIRRDAEQHSVSQPAPKAGSRHLAEEQTRLVVRLPKSADYAQAAGISNGRISGRRHRENSSSSSTDTSMGVSTKYTSFDTTVFREQRQEELAKKRKVMKSEILLRKMQRLTQKDRVQETDGADTNEKLIFINKLANYFRKNDFASEPLNRSILNAMAEWLSPLPNGKLPPVKLRDSLIALINGFTLKTPAQVFQTSSIEGVLILLMNHPEETLRNKRLEWYIVNSWRDD